MSFRTLLSFLLALFALSLQPLAGRSSSYEIDDEHKARSLAVLNHVTGWSLDSAGYHPAVYMLLENISGKDLSGVTIKMQGKFTDIHTLEPSTAKVEIRRSLKPHQQFPVALIAPKEYELPRDVNFWPVMECKAMMRVGNVGDDGTEYLLITKVDSTTATQDDSFQKLNELTSYNRPHPESHANRNHNKSGASEAGHAKPLVAARAEQLKASPAANKDTDFFQVKVLPCLGDDFYNFEKAFGLPVLTEARKKDFTWAKYKLSSGAELVVASKERSGKADLIAFVLPRHFIKGEHSLIEQGKRFCAASLKNARFASPAKSVRYLPSGRQEFVSSNAPGVKILCLGLPETSGQAGAYLVIVSRLSQEPYEFLHSQKPGNEVLKHLPLAE